jgi:hypothetical protein
MRKNVDRLAALLLVVFSASWLAYKREFFPLLWEPETRFLAAFILMPTLICAAAATWILARRAR